MVGQDSAPSEHGVMGEITRSLNRRAVLIFLAAALPRVILTLVHFSSHYELYLPWQTYYDFTGYYSKWGADIAAGFIPYVQFYVNYPPLFVYSIFITNMLGIGPYLISLSDALVAVVIYRILLLRGDERIALVGALAWAFLPFALITEGLTLFGEEPMILFLSVSFYCLLRKRIPLASVVFAIAVLLKQEALFAAPLFLAYCWRAREIKSALLWAAVILGASAPFLVLAPYNYINMMSYGLINLPVSLPSLPGAVTSGVQGVWHVVSSAPNPVCSTGRFTVCTNPDGSVFTLLNEVIVSGVSSLLVNTAALLGFVLTGATAAIYRRFDNHILWSGIFMSGVLAALISAGRFYPYYYYYAPVFLCFVIGSRSVKELLAVAGCSSLLFVLPFLQALFPLFTLPSLIILPLTAFLGLILLADQTPDRASGGSSGPPGTESSLLSDDGMKQ